MAFILRCHPTATAVTVPVGSVMRPAAHWFARCASTASVAASSPRRGHKVSIVLLKQLDNLGHAGQEVQVAPGYARNFLIPGRAAVYATTENKARYRVVLPDAESRANALEREINMLKARIASMTLRYSRATNDGVNLYGSVTPADVVESLAASVLRKLGIAEKNVRFPGSDRALKQVGEHAVEIEPREGLWVPLKLVIESS